MNRGLEDVITKFGEAWVSQDPEALMALITDENLKYYESTFEEPVTEVSKVAELWSVVPTNQKDITWEHEIIMSDDSRAIVHVKVTRTLVPSEEYQDIDAVFVFGFDKSNKINYFRQWRMLRS